MPSIEFLVFSQHSVLSAFLSSFYLLWLAQKAFAHGNTTTGVAKPLDIILFWFTDVSGIFCNNAAVFTDIGWLIFSGIAQMLCLGSHLATGFALINFFLGRFFRSSLFCFWFCCHTILPLKGLHVCARAYSQQQTAYFPNTMKF